jgi:hypothetical protein
VPVAPLAGASLPESKGAIWRRSPTADRGQVAEWAGHSVAILLKIYAKCLDVQDAISKRRIEEQP